MEPIPARIDAGAPSSWRLQPSGAPHRSGGARELLGLLAAAVAIRLGGLALDSHPRFFLGDSASYLDTAFGHWIPPDRSWLYGLGVNLAFRVTHRMGSVMFLQSLLSAAACASVAALLRRLGVRPVLAWSALILVSLDPMLHYYDRSFLTDAPGTAAVWLGMAFAAAALVWGGAWRWAVATLSLWMAISLRTAVLPVIVFLPAFALVARTVDAWRAGPRGRALLLAVAGPAAFAAAVGTGLFAYAVVTGKVTGSRPQLNPKSGYFLLGAVAPILEPVDFRRLGLRDPAALLDESHHERFALRNEQIYLEDGLLLRIERETGSWQWTSRIGSRAANRAIRRDPLGFARLVLETGAAYFRPTNYLGRSFDGGFGLDRPLPDGLVASLRKKTGFPVEPGMPAAPSPILASLRGWSVVLPVFAWLGVLLPLLVLLPVRRDPASRVVLLLLGGATWIYLLATFAFSTVFVQRYLLVLSPVIVTMLAVEAERCASWIERRRSRGLEATP